MNATHQPILKSRFVEIVLIALLYFVSARIGQAFAIPPGNVTPIWLPSGIMVALAYIRGPSIWPGVFLGAFSGNIWAYFTTDSFLLSSKAIFAGLCNGIGDVISTVCAIQLFFLITSKPNILGLTRDFALFILVTAILGTFMSALFGVTSLAAMSFLEWSAYWSTFITWWTGDGVGVLLLSPLIIAWYNHYKYSEANFVKWKVALLFGSSIFVASVLFKVFEVPIAIYLLSYGMAPILLIASVYLGQKNCFTALLLFSSIAIGATSFSIGPFTSASQNLNLLELQLFIAILSVVACYLSISVKQRLDAENQIKDRESSLAEAQQIAKLGSWELDLTDNSLYWSLEVYRIFEIDPNKFQASYEGFLNGIHPDDRDFVNQAYSNSLKTKLPYEIEHRLLMEDGRVKYVQERCETKYNEKGEPIRSLGTVQDITERKRAEEKIVHQAHFDSLTELPNRFLSLDRLSQLLLEADRDQTKVAVVFLDLDFFKNVNDSLGHDAGDALLVSLAKRLQKTVRAGDTIGRLGGDEFLVLLRGLHQQEEAKIAVEHLLESFKKPFDIEGRELYVSASIGVVMYPGGGNNATEVLRNADLAMYRSKDLGRNHYSFFSDEMTTDIARRISVEEQMRTALEKGEFNVHYQAQIDVKTKKIIGAEALLRWNNETLGQIFPDEFIPIAEQTGLIVPIGQFVISSTLEVLSKLKNMKVDRPLTMAINLSPRQFKDESLIEHIQASLNKYEIQPACLEFEITEGVLMSGFKNVEEILNSIHALGLKISLDDFGTGYSSLSYIRNYPFDSLKIDRSFVGDIEEHKGKELVNAAIAMAHALGLKVYAEGVETEGQLDVLKGLDCDYAQGYLFSKPLSENDFLDFVSNPK